MRHSHGVQHAVLGVVSRNPEGIHGYAVRRQGERLLGHFWRLNFGEVYRILDRLVGRRPDRAGRRGRRVGAQGLPHHHPRPAEPRRLRAEPADRRAASAPPGARREAAVREPGAACPSS